MCKSAKKPHISHQTAYTSCEWCAVCGARYTVCAARCTVYGVARELRLDRECGNADIGGTRMVEDCVQPFKNMKQVLYTKSAYRFWARPYVTNSTHDYHGSWLISMPGRGEIKHSAMDSAWMICSELPKRPRTIEKRRTALCLVLIHDYRGS